MLRLAYYPSILPPKRYVHPRKKRRTTISSFFSYSFKAKIHSQQMCINNSFFLIYSNLLSDSSFFQEKESIKHWEIITFFLFHEQGKKNIVSPSLKEEWKGDRWMSKMDGWIDCNRWGCMEKEIFFVSPKKKLTSPTTKKNAEKRLLCILLFWHAYLAGKFFQNMLSSSHMFKYSVSQRQRQDERDDDEGDVLLQAAVTKKVYSLPHRKKISWARTS